MKQRKLLRYALLVFCALFPWINSGCKKKEPQIFYTILQTEDISIPSNYTVRCLDFFNEDIIYALCYDQESTWMNVPIQLFKTSNGGQSWTELQLPQSANSTIQGLAVLGDGDFGIVCNNRLFRTIDDGASWVNGFDVFCIGKTPENSLVFAEHVNSFGSTVRILECEAGSTDFTLISSLNYNITFSDFIGGSLQDGVFHFYRAQEWSDQQIFGYDFANNEDYTVSFNSTAYNYPRYLITHDYSSVYLTADGHIYTMDGKIDHYPGENISTSFESGARIKDYYVAVSRDFISTNFKGYWQELRNPDKEFLSDRYCWITPINDTYFYLGGENGKITKCWLD
jgi:hypothetical protein